MSIRRGVAAWEVPPSMVWTTHTALYMQDAPGVTPGASCQGWLGQRCDPGAEPGAEPEPGVEPVLPFCIFAS